MFLARKGLANEFVGEDEAGLGKIAHRQRHALGLAAALAVREPDADKPYLESRIATASTAMTVFAGRAP